MSAVDIISLSYPLYDLPQLLQAKPLSIAIGFFDGVHRGHQNVIRRAVQEAKAAGILSAVMTFDPHPKEVLGHGEQYYRCLTPLEEKTALFKELGVDLVLVMQFDIGFAAVTPQLFVEDVLRKLTARHVAVGFDFTFGHKGSGDTKMLQELCSGDIRVHIVDPLFDGEQKVSSTFIRESLEKGDVQKAKELLGRSYQVSGTVVHGDGRGRTIGYSTANVKAEQPYVMPKIGVYAITAVVDGERYMGVLNHGMKPTFQNGAPAPSLEAHLFHFDRDIYGETLEIEFQHYIRAEQKFGSVDELIAQINRDADKALQLLQDEARQG